MSDKIKGTGVRSMKEAYAVVVQFVAFLVWIGTSGVALFEAGKLLVLHGDRGLLGWAAVSIAALAIMLEAGRMRIRIRETDGHGRDLPKDSGSGQPLHKG